VEVIVQNKVARFMAHGVFQHAVHTKIPE